MTFPENRNGWCVVPVLACALAAISPAQALQDDHQLDTQLQSIAAAHHGHVALYAHNLRSGQTASLDPDRSEEHTSELQSLTNLVCRLLLEKKNRPDRQVSDDVLVSLQRDTVT